VSKTPAFNLDTAAYLADTSHLSLPHHGAYLLILMTMWRADGWIADDERVLASICKISVFKWRALAPLLRQLFLPLDGKLSQKRLLLELERSKNLVAKARLNGSRGGAAKALKQKDRGLATATVPPDASPADRQNPTSERSSLLESNTQDQRLDKNKKGSSRGTALPSGWQPTASLFAYGRNEGLTDTEIRSAAENMRLWAKANSNRAVGRKADWPATFQGWLRRDADRKRSAQLRLGQASSGRGGMAEVHKMLREGEKEEEVE
jgi:uncharacterized protein YdaU (DUF1376 family)